MEKTKHQRIGESNKFRAVTTGKAIIGADIPPGGLRQSMFHPEVGLTMDDIFKSNVIKVDDIQEKISTFSIFEAICSVYPEEIENMFKDHINEYPRMPEVDYSSDEELGTTRLAPYHTTKVR